MKMKKKAVKTVGAGLLAMALIFPASSAFACNGGAANTNTTTTTTNINAKAKYTDNSVSGLLNNILSGNVLSNNQINLLNGNGIGILGIGAANNSGNTIQK